MKLLRRNKNAAVLGCGPAGLFAAHALIRNGWRVRIYSRKRVSDMYGAQYLHAPIPGLSASRPVTLRYDLVGTVDDYREKVYGPSPEQILVSPQALESEHPAWDIREAYLAAWDRYADLITDTEVSPAFLGVGDWGTNVESPSMLFLDNFNLIVSTIPAKQMCFRPEGHRFHSTFVYAKGEAPDRGQFVDLDIPANTVICNGSRDTGWYRASNVFGHKTIEWPGRRKPPVSGVASVEKPLYSDCSCWIRPGDLPRGTRYLPLGRYGAWSKNQLSHHAFEIAARQ